jgi:NAD(P) transhydrogenase subunit alpha
MDALTSQANVAGYKAALLAAEAYGGFFPMLMTAAGTTRPAQVLVLGAGVAGLQAIATARRLGARSPVRRPRRRRRPTSPRPAPRSSS